MKPFVVALIGALFVTGAHAQDEMMPSPAISADGVIRITTFLRTTVASEDGGADKAPEARKALYAMAESECTALTEIFKAECRLSALSIGHLRSGGKGGAKGDISATAVYHLRKASPQQPRPPKR